MSNCSDVMWKSERHGEMRIGDMDDEHLRNAIRMIWRGEDRSGRFVAPHTRALLPFLLEEKAKRQRKKGEVEVPVVVEKLDKKKYDLIDVRFAENPNKVYTYKVRKGGKVTLGQKLVAGGENGTSIVFVVGINTGREFPGTLREITEKVVKI